ncbi:Uncharacterised protein [Bordetella pertussis]|nr:Uncharacterised protein [Bordetella pertussis]
MAAGALAGPHRERVGDPAAGTAGAVRCLTWIGAMRALPSPGDGIARRTPPSIWVRAGGMPAYTGDLHADTQAL